MSDPTSPRQSTSFRRDEIEVMCAVFNKASTKTDVTILLRSEAAQRLHRKFLGLRERARHNMPDEASV